MWLCVGNKKEITNIVFEIDTFCVLSGSAGKQTLSFAGSPAM